MTATVTALAPAGPVTITFPLAWVTDPELRPGDLGTLIRIVVLLQHQDTLTLEQISLGSTGLTATRTAVDNLIRLGYVERGRLRTSGRYRGVAYRVIETRP